MLHECISQETMYAACSEGIIAIGTISAGLQLANLPEVQPLAAHIGYELNMTKESALVQ